MTFEEVLHDKAREMRNGFSPKGKKCICLVPRREFHNFLERVFSRLGMDSYVNSAKPSIEYFGFILVNADVDEIMFVVEI